MKKKVSLLLVLGMIAALVLGGCGKKDDSKALVGDWQATMEMADTLNDSFGADPTMSEYIHIDSFAVKLDLSLRDDGTCSLAVNEDSVTEAFDGIKGTLKDGLTAYLDANGMSADVLAANGMDIDSYMDEMISPEMISQAVSSASVSGNYAAQDGKLYFLGEGETKPGDNSGYMPYTLSGSKLTLDKPVNEDVGALADYFPLEFTK